MNKGSSIYQMDKTKKKVDGLKYIRQLFADIFPKNEGKSEKRLEGMFIGGVKERRPACLLGGTFSGEWKKNLRQE